MSYPPNSEAPEERQQRRLLRDALDEIASLGLLRRVDSEGSWATAEPFEQRLLATLDYAMSLRVRRRDEPWMDFSDELRAHATDWPFFQAGRAFAWAFTLASTPGAIARAELRGVCMQADDETAPLIADALALGSSSILPNLLDDLLDEDTRPWCMRIGLEVARRRRSVDAKRAIVLVEHPREDIAAEAVRALATLAPDLIERPLLDALDRSGCAARLRLGYFLLTAMSVFPAGCAHA
jgi:hypothetical protein